MQQSQQLKYHLLFSEKVDVTGTPTFNVLLGSGTVTSKYKSGSGTTNLEFSRLLAVVDSDADGFSTGTLLNLSLISGITITDQSRERGFFNYLFNNFYKCSGQCGSTNYFKYHSSGSCNLYIGTDSGFHGADE